MLTLRKIFSELALKDAFFKKIYILSQLEEMSEKILGANISKHCRFSSFEDGTITIECDDNIWTNELKKMKRQIKKRLEEHIKFPISDVKIQTERKK
ncbi:MAG: DUF721 domain-containing protein [Fervidobacterium sp.]|uniref:DUF721 domain-containing protein n=1 Tax=Fervidobacterium gondwanense DSM 13020 TaxID=1121883 RepID=A0A1M7SHT5_FERGO|nr:DUF721 domain-containing protein [Fervidobacterium gondwanense]UXF01649.1 hypothetical protein IB67_09015 [Fervidobacterium riparium]SHN58041.1 Protein of unknown function [Fervidobacterium gondwanense DSM 13020]